MMSHVPPYEKFYNPDEYHQITGQAPAGYPGYPGAPISLNQTVNAAPPGQHTVVVTQPGAANVSTTTIDSSLCSPVIIKKSRNLEGIHPLINFLTVTCYTVDLHLSKQLSFSKHFH